MKSFRRILRHNRFLLLVLSAIGVTIIWVVVSVTIYMRDGTHLLDLSRPGYEPAREQVKETEDQKAFDDDGPVDKTALSEFLKLYQAQSNEINTFDPFNSSALADEHLKINP